MHPLLAVATFGVFLSTVVPFAVSWCVGGRPVLAAECQSREVVAL